MICIVCYGCAEIDPSLLKLSRETGLPIAAPTYDHMKVLEHEAEKMGFKIPTPELILAPHYSSRPARVVLVSDAHMFALAEISKYGARFVSIDAPSFGIYSAPTGLLDLLKWWWKRRDNRRR